MSSWIFCELCIALLIGSVTALDVPFVFDESTPSIADYTSAQLEQISATSPDLAEVPVLSTERYAEEFDSRVEPENPIVHHEALLLAEKYPGNLTIDQLCYIYDYLINGNDSINGWSYVHDPRGIDYYEYANESLQIGKKGGCVGAGDCDDFAILMAALVESIGGTSRIIFAHNKDTGHAFTEVYLGRDNGGNSQIESIISWLMQEFDTDKIYTSINTTTKDVWLNLDWQADHPGGAFYSADIYTPIFIRDIYEKKGVNLPGREANIRQRRLNVEILMNTKEVEKSPNLRYEICLAGPDLDKVQMVEYHSCSRLYNQPNNPLGCYTSFSANPSNNFSTTFMQDLLDFSCRATITTKNGNTFEKSWPESTAG